MDINSSASVEKYLMITIELIQQNLGIFSKCNSNIYCARNIYSNSIDIKPGVELLLKDTYCHEVIKRKK